MTAVEMNDGNAFLFVFFGEQIDNFISVGDYSFEFSDFHLFIQFAFRMILIQNVNYISLCIKEVRIKFYSFILILKY